MTVFSLHELSHSSFTMSPTADKSATPHLNPPSPQKTALVVGSDPDIAAAIATVLPDWNIERVRDNAAALALITLRAYALVITGTDTSGGADLDLLRKIRLIRPHTRLIIRTNESTPADVIASMRERAFSYFSEPLSWDVFAEMVQLAAEGPCWDDGIEVLSATPTWIRLAARCDKMTADRLLQFFHEIAELPDSEKLEVASAFREMLLNAIEHGGKFDPEQYVEVSYLRARHMVICRIKDPGKGFSLDEIYHAATLNPPEDPLQHQAHRDSQGLRPGGFGVLLARSFVDEVIYSEKGNDVLLVKYVTMSSGVPWDIGTKAHSSNVV